MFGNGNDAEKCFENSLLTFFLHGQPDKVPAEEEFLILLDAITEAKSLAFKLDSPPFEQTIELCVQKFLEQFNDFKPLLRFFEVLHGEKL